LRPASLLVNICLQTCERGGNPEIPDDNPPTSDPSDESSLAGQLQTMKNRRREASREHGFQDETPEGGWSPQRQRFAEQVELLMRALRSTDEGVRELSVVQVSLMGPKAVPYLSSALEEALDESDRHQSAHESMSGAERAIAGICSALGIIRDSDAVVNLAAALPRKEAVEALAKIGGERALELIMDMIENRDSSWPSTSADSDPAFVRRVFLRFGEAGRRRLQEELADASGPKRAAVAEIIRIMGDPEGPE